MINEKLLAVIVPVYNVETYINKCLASVTGQLNEQLQVIIVNDGSTDQSGVICERYRRQYPQIITYVRQKHSGLGAARNAGLQRVSARYVTFLDGDDWYLPETIAQIVHEIQLHGDCDIFFTMPQIYNMSDHSIRSWYDADKLYSFFAEQDEKKINGHTQEGLFSLQPSCCARVYRVSFLRGCDFAFQENILWEDIFPHFFLLDLADSCRLIEKAGFAYRRGRADQITNFPDSKASDLCVVYENLIRYANQHAWSEAKRGYIHQRMMDYVFWRCRISSSQVRKVLLQEMHNLFQRCNTAQRKEVMSVLRVPKYRLFCRLMMCPAYPLVHWGYCLSSVRRKAYKQWRKA